MSEVKYTFHLINGTVTISGDDFDLNGLTLDKPIIFNLDKGQTWINPKNVSIISKDKSK